MARGLLSQQCNTAATQGGVNWYVGACPELVNTWVDSWAGCSQFIVETRRSAARASIAVPSLRHSRVTLVDTRMAYARGPDGALLGVLEAILTGNKKATGRSMLACLRKPGT